ncbi:MAG: FAD-binding oxidoreductase [bacterium]|nr:FAD-binding oxidoreductase [bacterium]
MVPTPKPYIIEHRIQTTHNVIVFNLEPQEGDVFDFRPGQFVMVALYGQDGQPLPKAKPYSVCSSPLKKSQLQIAFKIQGEFTNTLAQLKAGDRVGISGPFGVFTYDEKKMTEAVFLAGGIGITPFVSMFRYATGKQLSNSLTLLFANQTPEDIVFLEDLQLLDKQNPHFTAHFVVERPEADWQGETGRVNKAMLEKYCQPVMGKYFFVCGPDGFIIAMTEILKGLSVDAEHIKVEKF